MTNGEKKPRKTHWLYQKRNLPKLWGILVMILAMAIAPEFFIDHHHNFTEHSVHVDGSWGFYAWYAFVTCVLMVVIAKILGLLLKRSDHYYDN